MHIFSWITTKNCRLKHLSKILIKIGSSVQLQFITPLFPSGVSTYIFIILGSAIHKQANNIYYRENQTSINHPFNEWVTLPIASVLLIRYIDPERVKILVYVQQARLYLNIFNQQQKKVSKCKYVYPQCSRELKDISWFFCYYLNVKTFQLRE